MGIRIRPYVKDISLNTSRQQVKRIVGACDYHCLVGICIQNNNKRIVGVGRRIAIGLQN